MDSPFELQVTLGHPATPEGAEPDEPSLALVRVVPRVEPAVRPQLDLSFVLDSSASMHRFVLAPEERERWRRLAEQRGEVARQQADGRMGMVWTGQTLRELQRVVSTPMLSALRGVWRTLEALQLGDRISVMGFADQFAVIYEDQGAADQPARLAAARTALERLGSGVDQSGLGRGTRLQGALQHALERSRETDSAPVIRRILLVSDGIIEDTHACRQLLDEAVERGLVVSVIGVGDEFDEEFLMTTADLTRGSYYYAATAKEVEQAVRRELEIVTNVLGRQAVLRIQPDNGTVIHDVFPFAPEISEFQTVWVERGGWRFRIGDVSASETTEFLVRLHGAAHPAGEIRLGTVRLEGLSPVSPESFAVDAPVKLYYADDPRLLQARDDEVLDAVERLAVYKEERLATAAARRGDRDAATRHLQKATKMLQGLGAEDLARDMGAAAEETQAGTRNLTLDKRVKAGTRRLGGPAPKQSAPAETGGTRNLTPPAAAAPPEEPGGTRSLR